nr:hypothetical protein [uncultured Desulfobulbus sp.]
MASNLEDFFRNFRCWQYQVSDTRCSCTLRHSGIFGCSLVLDCNDPSGLFNCFNPLGAICASSGKYDSYSILLHIDGQRPKKNINGVPHPSGGLRLFEMQLATANSHITVGGDDIDGIRFNSHSFFGRIDAHLRVASKELRQQGFMGRI